MVWADLAGAGLADFGGSRELHRGVTLPDNRTAVLGQLQRAAQHGTQPENSSTGAGSWCDRSCLLAPKYCMEVQPPAAEHVLLRACGRRVHQAMPGHTDAGSRGLAADVLLPMCPGLQTLAAPEYCMGGGVEPLRRLTWRCIYHHTCYYLTLTVLHRFALSQVSVNGFVLEHRKHSLLTQVPPQALPPTP